MPFSNPVGQVRKMDMDTGVEVFKALEALGRNI
jgi:hypothetical protein